MSVTEEEAQSLDAGWDDEPISSAPSAAGGEEAEVDEAWDSIAPAVPSASAAPSVPPQTEEVDSGWDDVPEGAPLPAGKRRPHRPRRKSSASVALSTSPVLSPRPAEPTKKHQRELQRQKRAQEAQVKQQRKLARKQQRAEEARAEAAERLRKAEAEAEVRLRQKQARDEARAERPVKTKPKPVVTPSPVKSTKVEPRSETKVSRIAASTAPVKRGPRVGVIVTAVVLLALLALLLLNR